MIKRKDITAMFNDYALLLEKQTEGFSKDFLIDFLESVSKSGDLEVPDIVLGDDLQHLYFKNKDNSLEIVTTEGIKKLSAYFEFERTGNVLVG